MRSKFYRMSAKAWRVHFADNLKMELNYYRCRGYHKFKLETLVKSIQARYQGATYGRAMEAVKEALDCLGVEYDERYVYLQGVIA